MKRPTDSTPTTARGSIRSDELLLFAEARTV